MDCTSLSFHQGGCDVTSGTALSQGGCYATFHTRACVFRVLHTGHQSRAPDNGPPNSARTQHGPKGRREPELGQTPLLQPTHGLRPPRTSHTQLQHSCWAAACSQGRMPMSHARVPAPRMEICAVQESLRDGPAPVRYCCAGHTGQCPSSASAQKRRGKRLHQRGRWAASGLSQSEQCRSPAPSPHCLCHGLQGALHRAPE